MDGIGEHHSERGQPGPEDKNSYVLPRMQTLDLNKCSNVVGLESHDKGRTHTGDIGIGRKPKI
jgi:hypothetical protein